MIYHQSIAFALITFYPKWYKGKLRSISHTDKVRGDLALEFIYKASSLHYQVVIVDGYSSKSFRKEINKFTNIYVQKRRSIKKSFAKKQAFKTAAKIKGIKVIIATEPEKVSLIDYTHSLVEPILKNEADIIIPKRDDNLFNKTYPDYMYKSEIEGNMIYNQQLRAYSIQSQDSGDFDYFFGPRVFRNESKVLTVFTGILRLPFISNSSLEEYLDIDEISNGSFFPLVLALKKKLRVLSVQIPFAYPKTQLMNETFGAREFFIKKRQAQKLEILLQLMYLLYYLQTSKTSF